MGGEAAFPSVPPRNTVEFPAYIYLRQHFHRYHPKILHKRKDEKTLKFLTKHVYDYC